MQPVLIRSTAGGDAARFRQPPADVTVPTNEPRAGRLLRAFLIAPLAAPAAYVGALLIVDTVRRGLPSTRAAADLVVVVATVGLPVAYAATVLTAVPLYFLLRRIGRATRRFIWTIGAIIGTAVAALLAPQLRGELFSIPFPWWAGSALGVVSAELFWRVLTAGGAALVPDRRN